ncbi:UNVERIFIED_CONTAM: hypothetical protein Slati_0114800 [Sesamum latifolium]|uniref:Transposase (putative) gypsy type domain-containing protein n=1 Tax=Sesamum latifolium TaxID=2727402 RepID=A0AAW2Y8W3_9LAMI
MSSIDESVQYVGENPGEGTSKRSGSPLPSYVTGWRWSLRQAARRLLDESSEEEGNEQEENSSPGETDPVSREERVLFGNRGSRPVGSAWVACCLRQSDIYQLVEEFAIPPEFVVSVPPPDSHPSSPPPGYMSFFTSQLRAGLRFPIPSFFCEVSRELQVHLNQLVPNSIRIFVSFSVVLRYNNLIPTFGVFSQCFQLKQTEPGVFHFAPRRGVSFLPTPSPPKRWKGDFFFVLPPRPWNIPHRWIYESPPAMQVSLADRSFNLCDLLNILNERPYDCRELTKERLLSHFGLSLRIVSLQESLDDIMFGKHLKDEHRDATTPPATRPRPNASPGVGQGCCAEGRNLIAPSRGIKPGSGGSFQEEAGGPGRTSAGGGGQVEGFEEGDCGKISAGGEGGEKAVAIGGKNLLEACLASRLAEHKKSDAYQKEVALVAGPFLRFAFEAWRKQFLAHGYPPAGQDTSFLNFELLLDTAPDPFAKPTATDIPTVESEEDLDRILGEAEAEVWDVAVEGGAIEEKVPDESLPKSMMGDVPGPSGESQVQEKDADVDGKAPVVGWLSISMTLLSKGRPRSRTRPVEVLGLGRLLRDIGCPRSGTFIENWQISLVWDIY